MVPRRAFTLIELLVVIAIIAILAAILFPVFAQAKVAAKKTADLSNVKQFALGTNIYLSDSDDTMPLQAGKKSGPDQANAAWNQNSRILVPANWSASANADWANGQGTGGNASRVNGSLNAAPNAIQPYLKSLEMYTMPGAPKADGAVLPVAGEHPANVSYVYNGLMSSFNASGTQDPSGTPAWWPAFGQVARVGDTYANPFLICSTGNAACVFNGGGQTYGSASTCAGFANGNTAPNGSTSGFGNIHYTSWAFGKAQNWAFADGHAKSRPSGTGDQTKDPFPLAGYNAAGVPDSVSGYTGYEAVFDSQCHAPLFRPDTQHS